MQILTSVKAYQLPHVLYLRASEQWKRGEYNKPRINCGDTKGGQLSIFSYALFKIPCINLEEEDNMVIVSY